MKAVCLKDSGHKRFVTVATVTEDWIVDENGDFIEVCPNSDMQVVHYPDAGNIWTCEVCGEDATVT